MNLKEIHAEGNDISAKHIPGVSNSRVISLRTSKNGLLKEHSTKEPALLVCVLGKARYEDENGKEITLLPGDFHGIEPGVKHWVRGVEESQLLLIK